MRIRVLIVAFVLLVSGCGQRAAIPGPDRAAGTSAVAATPDVLQNGTSMTHWKQFTPHPAESIFRGITTGSDGNIWFSDQSQLVRINMSGGIREFNLSFTEGGSTFGFGPIWLGTGADGKIYVNCDNCVDPIVGGGIMGVVTTAGRFTMHRIPSKDLPGSNGFGIGPDGNTWFAEQGHIAKITPGGTITEFAYPSGENQNTASVPVTGPDGDMWFTEYFKHKVAKINPTTSMITEFDVSAECSGPQGLAVGSDGKLYFICGSSQLASITTGGTLGPAIANPYGTPIAPGDIITASNHHIWFATNTRDLGEYNENTGTLTTHTSPFSTGEVLGLTNGPDTNLWGSVNDGLINVYIFATLSVSPKSLTFASTRLDQTLTATYRGPSTLTATSASTAIATVAPGSAKNTFVVTSQSAGKTKVTVKDTIGNLFTIPVTVE